MCYWESHLDHDVQDSTAVRVMVLTGSAIDGLRLKQQNQFLNVLGL